MLVGDWASNERFADIYLVSFSGSLDRRVINATRRANTLYFVYMNNLTPASAAHLDLELRCHQAYVGCVDLTCMSLTKVFLSTMLIRIYIQHRSIILQGHENDRHDMEDVNLIGYDFKKAGYTVRSVPLWMYGWFLSYKIERPVLPDEESDTRFSLSAMTPVPCPIARCLVELDEHKLEYLQAKKAGSLRRADFHALTAEEIAAQVRAKLSSNYIFNLARAKGADKLKFNIVLENPGVARHLCALEYQPQEQKLSVITLF